MSGRKIITIDDKTCKNPEDGFGVDFNENLFLAISIKKFLYNSVIFTFNGSRIFVRYGYVFVENSYNVDYFKCIASIMTF